MFKPMLIMSALVIALLTGSSMALAADQNPSGSGVRKQQTETVYGSQLMSAQERSAHRERMCAAASVEEQEQIRREHHEKMRQRAESRGLALPDTTPGRGPWMGSCGGMRPRHMAAYSTAGEAATIPYESTGIGSDEREGSKPANYNLHLVFATQGSGSYLADIQVVIEDARKNRILEADSPGPIFFAKLPPGTYRITANYHGKLVVKTVAVKDRGRSNAYFYWRDEDIDAADKSGR